MIWTHDWAGFMKKIYANPLYRLSKNTGFDISYDVIAQFDCPDYRDDKYDSIWEYMKERDEKIIDLIKRIFKKRDRRRGRDENFEFEFDFD